MIVKVGDKIFSSHNEPVAVLIESEERQQIVQWNPGNDVLFSYPTNKMTRESAWDLAVSMRDALVVEKNRLGVQPVAEARPADIPPPVPSPTQAAAPPVPIPPKPTLPESRVVADGDIVALTSPKTQKPEKIQKPEKTQKIKENGLTTVADEDILAMVGGKPSKEREIKTSDAVLTASFDVAATENPGETRNP